MITGSYQFELWKSDGTTAGTAMVDDIYPNGSSRPHNLAGLNGKVFFVASDPLEAEELWVSDGVNTLRPKVIRPGAGDPDIGPLVRAGDVLFFNATEDATGSELWAVLADIDLDGVPDNLDACANSNLAATVVIEGCDSGAPNVVRPTGCSISDEIDLCAAGARDHDGFMRCVTDLTEELERERIVTDGILACAAEARMP